MSTIKLVPVVFIIAQITHSVVSTTTTTTTTEAPTEQTESYLSSTTISPTTAPSLSKTPSTTHTQTTVPPTTLRQSTTKAPVKNTHRVCYEHVGCFYNTPPFDNAHHLLPKSPKSVGTKFSLYTRDGPHTNSTHIFIDYVNNKTISASNFSADKPTKFVVHGFANSIETDWPYVMKDELLKREDCNVLLVSWKPTSNFGMYDQAVANTRVVAEQIRMLILNLISIGSSFESIHMIGHSLGAHISGQVGQLLRKDNMTFGRITGLDPAEPDFKSHPIAVRLDKNDAIYVDVIHTNGAPVSSGGAGLSDPCGDVDYYVNGGDVQPDCPSSILQALFSKDMLTAFACSHSRAHEVFIESINSNNCQFVAYPCDDYVKFQNGECLSCGEEGCGVLGYDSNNFYATGSLYLNTRISKPFCGHHYGVHLMISNKFGGAVGGVKIQLNGTWGTSEWLSVTKKNDTNIGKGSTLHRVVVAENIIGQITSIKVQYDRSSVFRRNILHIYKIAMLSGESGKQYSFCLNSALKTGEPATFIPSENPCSDFQ
ncbi:hypothetical protein ACF0H5_005398 [Mactra antiquata]